MLHWWRVSGSAARESFPCTYSSTKGTRLDRPQAMFPLSCAAAQLHA